MTVHLLKEVAKGRRLTKCGISAKKDEVSVWASDVTCEECRGKVPNSKIIWD